jgi:hypothetical protein
LGADHFVFKRLSDSTVAAGGRTTITDFSSAQGDKIDLSELATSLRETLTFIGAAAFSGVAGQVRYSPSGADTLVTLDSTGSGQPNFSILLKTQYTLASSDFILGAPASASSAASLPSLVQAISAFAPSSADAASPTPSWTQPQDSPFPELAAPSK